MTQNFDANSTNGTEVRTNERTNEHTNGQTERRKVYTRRHKCRGYKVDKTVCPIQASKKDKTVCLIQALKQKDKPVLTYTKIIGGGEKHSKCMWRTWTQLQR